MMMMMIISVHETDILISFSVSNCVIYLLLPYGLITFVLKSVSNVLSPRL